MLWSEGAELVARLAALFELRGTDNPGLREFRGCTAVATGLTDALRGATRLVRAVRCSSLDEIGWVRTGLTPMSPIPAAGGVKFQVVLDTAVACATGETARLLDRAASGWQVRLLHGVPVEMVLIDDNAALLARKGDAAAEHVWFVRSSPLLEIMIDVFHTLWSLAAPVTGHIVMGLDDDGITEQDRALLVMLAAGATDVLIAEKLDLGLRTVQRRLQVLSGRLGARTRFQAGLNAAKRGWL
ncbi:hypothetical protein BBK82_08195 [Lentzea guizhouensis]|uniref:HTH luxR-type domain-containing protein n=1 Tax=Lentzea guizhouensis TaxID=1586287 RepID=A0A1B2HEB6_9PSEU|nr:hypothetical protein [Lentzea guizhouensis]ANZ36051.1 hypothetical protein BBK82_08195 [Lentzea guizhouensis]